MSLAPFPKYTDGYFGVARRISRTPREYPFRQNGDITTAVYTARYCVDVRKFTPTAGGAVDPETAGFYLLAESKPLIENGDLCEFERTYGNIPLTQVAPGSRVVPKPALSGTFPRPINGVMVEQPDPDIPTWTFSSRTGVTSDSGAPVPLYPTGSTYDISVGPDTATLAYNAAAATAATALNALTDVAARGGGMIVGGTYNSPAGLGVVHPLYAAAVIDTSALVVPNIVIGGATSSYTTDGATLMTVVLVAYWGASDNFTGGAFTATIFGQTTGAIPFNASFADIETEIQGLSLCGASVTVAGMGSDTQPLGGTGGAKVIRFTIRIPYPTITVDGSALTPAGSNAILGAGNVGFPVTFSQPMALTRVVVAPAHGITQGDNVIVVFTTSAVQTTGYISGTQYTVINADTIQFNPGTGLFYSDSINAVGKNTGGSYSADSPNVQVELVSYFWLPGVTSPIPTLPVRGTSAQLLAAIFAGLTTFIYEAGELSNYRESAILMFTFVRLNPALL
jgi:hypothetical protein